jgi:beta-lactamase superfamily II metal-dependent hydrolase
MALVVEALEARHGDALLLHWGDGRLIVVDGGPSGVFRDALRPRLDELHDERGGAALAIRLLMVSHIDDDHIRGVLDLVQHLADLRRDRRPEPWTVTALWHNAFDDVLGDAGPVPGTLEAAVRPVSAGGVLPAGLPMDRWSAAVVASVRQGVELRDVARALNLNVNRPWGALVTAPASGPRTVELEDGLALTVIGPLEAQVRALQRDWEKKLAEMRARQAREAQVIAAEFADRSVYNLASLVVLASVGGRRMLLTGDARGDHVLSGLEAAGLLRNGAIHVDLLKVPHHGSRRNVTEEFFRRVTADHYVVSADGRHGNPDVAALRWLTAARGPDEYTLHFTNDVEPVRQFLEADRGAGRRYHVRYRDPAAPSISVALPP